MSKRILSQYQIQEITKYMKEQDLEKLLRFIVSMEVWTEQEENKNG